LYPLFPSYLFVAGEETERLVALKTERIVRFVDVDEGRQAQLRAELAGLEQALRCFPRSVELYAHLAVGVCVRVKAGPLKNVEGVILQIGQRHKLWLGVSALGVGATVEIHPDLVEAL
jgi:transcription antitermination factor NusG